MTTAANQDLKILCVDDEPELRELVAALISDLGFAAVTCSSAEEACQVLAREAGDIVMVISDFRMPGCDGLEFRKRMLEKWKQVPFAILSAHVTREMALQAVELKVCAFLDKPFTEDSIRKLIEVQGAERIELIREERELLSGFVDDCVNMFEELESLILSLETAPGDIECINRIFGILHTIKGASGFFQPDSVHRYAHRLENLLSKLKNGESVVSAPLISALLSALDTLKGMVQSLKVRDGRTFDVDQLARQFEDELARPEKNAAGPAAAATPAVSAAEVSGKKAGSGSRDELRVSIGLLDEFMELSGEITVIRNMVKKLVRSIEKASPGSKDVTLLSDLLEEMHKINSSMQDKTAELRKVPMKNIYRPLSRVMRDLSTALKKEINFETSGDELRVDTAIAEVLNTSLIHMIRNSADHGIESPERRVAAGKGSLGTLKVQASESGENVIIELSDDGAGIDPAVVRAKLLEKKMFTEAALAVMPRAELLSMIFAPGFSTAAQVTNVSGRGVGMDMVKTSVERIGGQIEIDSRPGEGTCFRLVLPIPKSVLIVNSLLVEIGNQTFAIPQENIIRLLVLDEHQAAKAISNLEGAEVLDFEGHLLPLVRLESILPLAVGVAPARVPTLNVVIVRAKEAVYGIAVDAILDIEDTVVKKLKTRFTERPIYAGATFLGDGRVGLILDTTGIAQLFRVQPGERKVGSAPGVKPPEAAAVATAPSEYVLFQLDGPGMFAVPLIQVHRLERFAPAAVSRSGDTAVVIYRDRIVPLLDCSSLLAEAANLSGARAGVDDLSTLILETASGFCAFVVKEILDIATTVGVVDHLVRERAGVAGNIVINDSLVTVLELEALMQAGLGSSFSALSHPRAA